MRYVRRKSSSDLRRYIDDELASIEATLRMPECDGAHFQALGAIPARYANGDVFYFLGGVAGANEGLYAREAGAWVKL